MVREVEPDRLGAEKGHGAAVLFPAQRDHVVAGLKATARVPRRGLVRVGGGTPAEHGDDGRAGVPGDEVGDAEGGVVEMGGHDHDPSQHGGVHETPRDFELTPRVRPHEPGP